jgi:hypothetical protein
MNSALVFGVIAASMRSRSTAHLPPSNCSGTPTERAPAISSAAAMFGQAGSQIDEFVAGRGQRLHGDLDRLHAGAGDEEVLDRKP